MTRSVSVASYPRAASLVGPFFPRTEAGSFFNNERGPDMIDVTGMNNDQGQMTDDQVPMKQLGSRLRGNDGRGFSL